MNKYYFSKIVDLTFDQTVDKLRNTISNHGFGIVTELDVTETFKKKLDVDFRNYRIFGACNPKAAFKAISIENKIGTMLPCNIIIQEFEDGKVEISAVDPVASMMAVENTQLADVAYEIKSQLADFIDNF